LFSLSLTTAQEICVGQVKENNDNETPQIYNQPIIVDEITFPLKVNAAFNQGQGAGI
jgi:hypothetical protein